MCLEEGQEGDRQISVGREEFQIWGTFNGHSDMTFTVDWALKTSYLTFGGLENGNDLLPAAKHSGRFYSGT